MHSDEGGLERDVGGVKILHLKLSADSGTIHACGRSSSSHSP